MIWFWILLIAIISVILALISYKKENKKTELKRVKEEIAKERVIYHSSSF